MKKIIKNIKVNFHKRKDLLEKNGLFSYINSQKGSVLIIVIMISTILFMISVDFFLVAYTNVEYTKKIKNEAQAKTIALSGLDIAKYILDADKRGVGASFVKGVNSDKKTDTLQDIWTIPFDLDGLDENGNGSIKIRINDQQAKINLSILATDVVDKTTYYGIFQRFLINFGLQIDLADTVVDWVDIDNTPFPYGAENYDFYSTLPKPYSAKNGKMDSIDELLMIKNFTPKIFYGIEKTVPDGKEEELKTTVDNNSGLVDQNILEISLGGLKKIPSNEMKIAPEKSKKLSEYLRVEGDRQSFSNELNKININTASYRVLSALTENMTDDKVAEIIKKRVTSPYTNVSEVSDIIEDESVRNEILTVSSNIFEITCTGEFYGQEVNIRAIYNRKDKRFFYWSIY